MAQRSATGICDRYVDMVRFPLVIVLKSLPSGCFLGASSPALAIRFVGGVQLVARQLGAVAVSGFALLALILASIGLYGVVSYAVSRRAHEVGIRLSLGADASSVVWMLTRDGMKLVTMGGVIGLVIAAGLSQLLSRLLYGVPALDPLTFLGVPLMLGTVALAASWIPALRVTRIDPVVALRAE